MLRSPWIRLALGVLCVAPVLVLQGIVWRWRPVLGPTGTAAVSGLIAALGGAAAYACHVRWIEKRPVTELKGPGAGAEAALGLLVGGGLFAATIGVLALCGAYRVVGTNAVDVILVPLFLSIGAGVIEEILFRGLLFRLVEQALGTWIALAVSSAFFGFGHLSNPHATVQGVVAIVFEAGILLAGAYLVTRRLWLAIGLHIGWNFTQSGVFGVPTSGVPLKGWLVGELDGPAWLSGGDFGAEASVVALVFCTAVGLALLRIARQRGRFIASPWRRNALARAATARSPATPDRAAAPSGP